MYISQVTHTCLSVHVELSLSLILSVYLPNFISAFLSLYVYLRSFSLSLCLPLPLSLTFFLSLRLCYTYLLTQLVTLFLYLSITHTFPPKFILVLNLPSFFCKYTYISIKCQVLDYFYSNYGGVWTGCFKFERSSACRGALAGKKFVNVILTYF